MRVHRVRRTLATIVSLVASLVLAAPLAAVADTSAATVIEENTSIIAGVVTATGGAPVGTVDVAITQQGGSTRWITASEDGSFELSGLPAGDYTLRFWPRDLAYTEQYWTGEPGGSPDPEDAVTRSVAPGEAVRDIDVVLLPSATISGTVIEAGGAAAPRAKVLAYRKVMTAAGVEWRRESISAGNPYVLQKLPAGEYTILFTQEDPFRERPETVHSFLGGGSSLTTAQTIHVATGDTRSIDARLSPGAKFSGILTTPTGAPIANTYVTLSREWAAEDRFIEPTIRSAFGARTVATDAQGRFTLTGLAAGDYLLNARHRGETVWWPNTVSRSDARRISIGNESTTTNFRFAASSALVVGTATVTGSLRTGSTLRVATSGWTPGTTFSYVWAANGYPIAGARSSTLTLADAQAGTTIEVAVTGTHPDYRRASLTAHPVGFGAVEGIFRITTPTVRGAAKVGATLTADRGGSHPGATYSYQWYANGSPVKDARQRTWSPTTSQAGKRITVKVTWRKGGFTPVSRTSAPTAKVLRVFSVPQSFVHGYTCVGKKMTFWRGSWGPGVTYTYRWYANGVAIPGATSTSITLKKSHVGKRMSVRITGKKAGYASRSFTTARSPKITRDCRL